MTDAATTPEPTEPEIEPIPRYESETDVPSTKLRYIVLGNTFVAQTENGELKAALFFPTKKIRSMPAGISLLAQIYHIFGEDSELCLALDELDITEAHEFADAFHQAYEEKQRARLGK